MERVPPIKSKTHAQSLAPMRLRLNCALNFLENEAFDPQLIDYTDDYENSQAHSTKFKDHMRSVLSLLQTALPKNSVIVEAPSVTLHVRSFDFTFL